MQYKKTTDIKSYLQAHEKKELVRFITCGSVDDGKSTLIGRLLYDSKMIFEDQLNAIKKDSKKHGTTGNDVDLALLVDGLQSERQQGITIDVAYRFFATTKRKYIIADTPGHIQYTRNMVTGASTSDIAIILIDARYGVQEQTRRHSFIVKLLGIQHIIVAINKMDLKNYDESLFNDIKSTYHSLAQQLGIKAPLFIPISALHGSNVVTTTPHHTPWYQGQSLLDTLDSIKLNQPSSRQINPTENRAFRFPIQYVNRPNANFRGFCGTIASGTITVGSPIIVLPSRQQSTVKRILCSNVEKETAYEGEAITLLLEDEIDISRGDTLVEKAPNQSSANTSTPHQAPILINEIDAYIVWMNEKPLHLGESLFVKTGAKTTEGFIEKIYYKKNMQTMQEESSQQLLLNDIAYIKLQVHEKILFESYQHNRHIGRAILIDKFSNDTVAAIIMDKESQQKSNYETFEIELNALIRKHFPHWGVKNLLT